MTESNHGGLIGAAGHDQGQAVHSSFDLALSRRERAWESNPRSTKIALADRC
jgi:hypothetical protein